jgi:hypothetical protein
MGALLSLNISDNKLGQMSLPQGWKYAMSGGGTMRYYGPNGANQVGPPAGAKAEGAIALANAIKDMGAMTSLNLASNAIGGYYDEDTQFVATPGGITALYCTYPTSCFSYHC